MFKNCWIQGTEYREEIGTLIINPYLSFCFGNCSSWAICHARNRWQMIGVWYYNIWVQLNAVQVPRGRPTCTTTYQRSTFSHGVPITRGTYRRYIVGAPKASLDVSEKRAIDTILLWLERFLGSVGWELTPTANGLRAAGRPAEQACKTRINRNSKYSFAFILVKLDTHRLFMC